jgi:hypothetical protein
VAVSRGVVDHGELSVTNTLTNHWGTPVVLVWQTDRMHAQFEYILLGLQIVVLSGIEC